MDKILSNKILPELISDMNLHNSTSHYTRYSFDASELKYDSDGSSDLAIFMLRFIGFKPKDKHKYNKDIEAKGFMVQSWLYSYSNAKLAKTFKFLLIINLKLHSADPVFLWFME